MKKGDRMSHFSLPDENGEVLDSDMLAGIRYVVFRSDISISGFDALFAKFMMRNVPVICISVRPPEELLQLKKESGARIKMLSCRETPGPMPFEWACIVGKDGVIEAATANPDPEKVLSTVMSLYKGCCRPQCCQ